MISGAKNFNVQFYFSATASLAFPCIFIFIWIAHSIHVYGTFGNYLMSEAVFVDPLFCLPVQLE